MSCSLKGVTMKIMATAREDYRNYRGELIARKGQEARVVDVLIHRFRTDVTLELPSGHERVNSTGFDYELVLPAMGNFDERRIPIDIIDDLMDDSPATGRRWWWYDMPAVKASYVTIRR